MYMTLTNMHIRMHIIIIKNLLIGLTLQVVSTCTYTRYYSLVNQPNFEGINFSMFSPPTKLNTHGHTENTVWFTRLHKTLVMTYSVCIPVMYIYLMIMMLYVNTGGGILSVSICTRLQSKGRITESRVQSTNACELLLCILYMCL